MHGLRPPTRFFRTLTCGLLSLLLGLSSFAVRAESKGRPLLDVLRELRQAGLNLIFSNAVVGEKLVVTVEPASGEPRALLDEILAPLGLEARDGPGGAVLIVRAAASAEGALRGRVLSVERGKPVVRATVGLSGTELRASTRPDGTFALARIPAGSYDVIVGAPGFSGATVGGVRIPPDTTVELVVTVEAEPSYVEEMIVTPSRHALLREDQTRRLNLGSEDAVLVPTLGGDVSRVVELLPGVAAADNSAAFNVRGSAARDVSMVLDGLELYEPFHLRNFQSPFSLIDAKIVDSIDFLGGGFTADLGDRHGGFVELTTALPESDNRGALELGSVNARVAYGLPTASGSFLASARAWYPEAILGAIELGEEGLKPRFEDLYLKYSRHVSPRMVLSAHGLVAFDRLDYVEPDGAEIVDSNNSSSYLWLRALRSWSPAVFSVSVLSVGRLRRSRLGISEPEDDALIVKDERSVEFLGLKHDLSWQLSDSHLIRTGFDVRPLRSDYRYTIGFRDDPASVTTIRPRPSGTSSAAYIAHRAAVLPGLATELGVRWDTQSYTDDEQFSPRFNAVWRAGERTDLRLGVGQFYQSQRIHELLVEDGETTFRRAELSRQAELTVQHRFRRGPRLRVDAYYRKLSRVHPRYENLFKPLELFPETEADRELVSPARARLRGVELLLRGDPERPLYWWTSYAWSAAEDAVDGRDVPRNWDQTHAGKFLLGYRWGERWSLSLSGSVHTGWPTTPVSGMVVVQPDGSTVIEPVVGPRNTIRYSDYARLDAKASRRFALARGRLRVDIEIVNLTDRRNVCCTDDFTFEELPDGSVVTTPDLDYWLGITPSFNVLWEF